MIALIVSRVVVRVPWACLHHVIIIPGGPCVPSPTTQVLFPSVPVTRTPLSRRLCHIPHALGRRAQVVEGRHERPERDLEHNDQDERQPDPVHPVWVVHVAEGVLGGRGVEVVERHSQDSAQQDGYHHPQSLQDDASLDVEHKVDVGGKVLDPVDPHDEGNLDDCDPHDGHPAAVVVHDLEDVGARDGHAGQAHQEAGGAEQEHEQRLVVLGLGDGIVEGREDGLQQRKLRVQSQQEQHGEEKDGPELGGREPGQGVRVGDEGEAGAAPDDVIDVVEASLTLQLPEDGEDDDARDDRGQEIQGGDDRRGDVYL